MEDSASLKIVSTQDGSTLYTGEISTGDMEASIQGVVRQAVAAIKDERAKEESLHQNPMPAPQPAQPTNTFLNYFWKSRNAVYVYYSEDTAGKLTELGYARAVSGGFYDAELAGPYTDLGNYASLTAAERKVEQATGHVATLPAEGTPEQSVAPCRWDGQHMSRPDGTICHILGN